MRIHRIRVLRRLVLPLLRRLNTDITIRHHWTKDPVSLHLFKHKGYWYHGRAREFETMALFSELVSGGDFALEIGGHIGYVSVHLSRLVGPGGQLVVFEPSPDNLSYLRKNTAAIPSVRIVDKAVTDYVGSANLYVEALTGQNNSLLQHYTVFEENREMAYVGDLKQVAVEVSCVTLDDFLRQEKLPVPSLIKIDVEGAEYSVLRGMQSTLDSSRVALMVEITERAPEVVSLLKNAGFNLFHPDRTPVSEVNDLRGNVFCLKDCDSRIAAFRRH